MPGMVSRDRIKEWFKKNVLEDELLRDIWPLLVWMYVFSLILFWAMTK
ncbi:hypothetical protein [Neomoorella thermoacetica]|nr:hypothetical protein [Moorella thermoacetica]